MNDCLPHRRNGRQRAASAIPSDNAAMGIARPLDDQPDKRGSAEVFARAFTGQPDLAHLSPAARRVLAMSAALFYERGAAATSIRDITRACGLSPGALYNHFASKDDVLYQLVTHGHHRLEQRLADALAEVAEDPVARTTAFVHAYVMGHLVHPELAQVVRREYLHLSAPRYEETVRRRRALRHELTRLLGEGAAAGRFDLIGGGDAPTRVAVMVLDMCSRTSEWYDPTRSDPPDELADRYVSAALRLAGVS
jgi:TetR/AcrR family transcriptional regulator, cholesterol catabolism regulator